MSGNYIYLHGFASSPRSAKAQYLRDRFQTLQINLQLLDLNQGDFTHLTLTRQIQQVLRVIAAQSGAITLIGSSFGGLTAAWVAQQLQVQPQLQRLVLLAPAFGFPANWLAKLSPEALQQWQSERYLSVYHYGEVRSLPLNYAFVTDASQYDEAQLQHRIPTLILHGHYDHVIPIQASRDYAAQRPWVKLIELDSDHTLGNVQSQIWDAIWTFCRD
ncbi:MAG: alpha/beta fold hydrolase [Cyanothece sp. SIO1E1]|nr:alpha/beta fold hydrolase [Cyanothece sp. SIO1E1]